MSVKQSDPQFGRLRALFWPIHGFEVKKFLPMAFMMFCALYNYTTLRNSKDAIVLAEIGDGAINICKLLVTLPLATFFFIFYTKLSNSMTKERVFYTCAMIFVVFFSLWGFVFYPFRDVIMGDTQTLDAMGKSLPFLYWPIMTFGKWFYALYYAMAELWGSVVVSLLFWQFANQITRVSEAKRYYAMFGLIGNFGAMLAGFMLGWTKPLSKMIEFAGWKSADIHIVMNLIPVIIFSFVFMYLYRFTNTSVKADPRLYDPTEVKPKKKKEKPSLGDSFKLVFSSQYLLLILILVVGYGVSVNLIEVTWKTRVKGYFMGDKSAISAFFGNYAVVSSIVTIVFMLIGQNIVRIWGWFVAAIATPIVILVTGTIFFLTIVAEDLLGVLYATLSMTPLLLSVYVGFFFQAFSKSTKYSLFDSTKEMSYIPLSDELKTKGKAAVDVVGGRLGKSGGSFIQFMIVTLIAGSAPNPYDIVAPYLYIFVILIMILWFYAVGRLSVEFKKVSDKTASEEK